jgi:c(7)-type cytochrome triheme protein
MKRALLILLLVGTASAGSVVYPLQRLPLIFSHQKHLARGAKCDACHASAATSKSAVDNLIPTEAACRACHQIDRAAATADACGKCHTGWRPDRPVDRVFLAPSLLKFPHDQHTASPCESCHPVRNVDLATTAQLPSEASCLSCHRDGSDERHCADCHLAKMGGLLETSFDAGNFIPASHGPRFKNDHKEQARAPGATCTACHDHSECVECHQGTVKPMDFHRGDYLSLHAVDARRGTPDCSACHRYETFCVGCHERSGIGMRGDTQFRADRPDLRFQPAGWSSKGPGPNLHAQEARRNITQCASCHREEDCLSCHSAEPGGINASPHPAGWRGSARCKALDRENRRMCLRCHVTQNELGCDWRATP